jgi:hypothetical protein
VDKVLLPLARQPACMVGLPMFISRSAYHVDGICDSMSVDIGLACIEFAELKHSRSPSMRCTCAVSTKITNHPTSTLNSNIECDFKVGKLVSARLSICNHFQCRVET